MWLENVIAHKEREREAVKWSNARVARSVFLRGRAVTGLSGPVADGDWISLGADSDLLVGQRRLSERNSVWSSRTRTAPSSSKVRQARRKHLCVQCLNDE